jgi:ABC-type antimicrobial peptide transport system permease subunit
LSLALALALPVDLFAITVLACAIYYRRHRRTDLALAYVALNVGVFSVSALMLSQQVSLGLAFGLFGVLSILRLRSDQISQRDVGYYFTALALGLINGIGASRPAVMIGLSVLLVATMYVADHPRLANRSRHRMVVLDTVHRDEDRLRADLEQRLDATVSKFEVVDTDYVRETMTVDVRFHPHPSPVRQLAGERTVPLARTR